MSDYTLTYRKDKSQEIYVEKIENEKNEHLYFEQEYKDARKLIKEIVDVQGTKNDNREQRKDKKNKIKKYGCNNRILFTGQRGCGKTSVMRSLAEYLSSEDNPEFRPKDDKDKEYDVKFSCLPMVDPSHFDNNNNILLTVITSMFSEAKRRMKEDREDVFGREDLLKQFEKVFKSLDSIKSELSSYTLESLNRKSDAEDLREKMNRLVDRYLQYQGCGDESRLLLLIDDIDMSVSYAPEMLEQLRKYLELDNLIILMSANLGQLSNEMREKYSSAFQNTLKDSNQALSIDVEDLATKYLLKLFPTSRRINVERHISHLLRTNLIISEPGKEDIKGEFQKVILSQIWGKTRLLFIPKDHSNTLHPIIPTNLRDLAQFLDMLTSLEKVEQGKENLFENPEEYNKCNKNLQVFKSYVMNTWIPNHLTVEEELVFHNIPTDITEINKHLINSINVIGTTHKTDLMSREVGLDMIERNAENINIDRDIYTMVSPNDPKFVKANKISDIFNQPSNYSYGDLLLMIDKYETYFESEEHRKFTDAIKIYYSILLFETMFFKSQNVDYTFEDKKEYEVIPIQKLIGGNVYYPNYFEIITDKNFNQKGPSFDAKRAFYHKVKVDDKKKVGDEYPIFAVLYYGDIRPDRYEKDHIYDTTFSKNAEVDGVNYVTFDILSILNNMLNPCHTLSRLDDVNFRPKENIWNNIVNAIVNWGKENTIGDMSIPNAILPFYSVDIMLQYLTQSYSATTVIGSSSNDYGEYKDLIELGWRNLFLSGDKIFIELLILVLKLRCKRILNNSNLPIAIKKEIITSIENGTYETAILSNNRKKILQKYSELIGKIIKYRAIIDSKDVNFNEIKKELLSQSNYHDDIDKILINNLYIITESVRYKDVVLSMNCRDYPIIINNLYRDFVISLLMEYYQGSKKDRNGLIKELHKFTTVTEIYKQLVEVLWENAITELLIRSDIQKNVRAHESVQNYYNLLWQETKTLLKKEGIPLEAYQNIYKLAKEQFLN